MLSDRARLGVVLAAVSLGVSAASAAAAVTPAPDRVTTIPAGRLGVDGAPRYGLRGWARIRTSDAQVRRTSDDGAPTARFAATVSDRCTARLQVSLRGVASSQFFSGSCSNVDARKGAAAKALGHMARTAQVRAHVVAVAR
jgi:hypothetical protein